MRHFQNASTADATSKSSRQTSCADIPILASYCVFAPSSRKTFVTEDSVGDERIRDHPKRLEVHSYCGVPLVDADGKTFGTICPVDLEAKPISDDNVARMEGVARLLAPADNAAPWVNILAATVGG